MIPGLTNKPRLNWLGIIRLGEKRKNAQGVEYPAKLDHFNFVDAPAVRERFGDNARTLSPILLPANPKPNGGGTWDFSSFWQTSRFPRWTRCWRWASCTCSPTSAGPQERRWW